MKTKILFIQPIFCHNDYTFELNKNSLESLSVYLKGLSLPANYLRCVFTGFCEKNSYWNEIVEIIDKISEFGFGDVRCRRERIYENKGKAFVVNESFKNCNIKSNYIFTCDSDIIFDVDEDNIFERLIKASNIMENKAIISLNQKYNNQQNLDLAKKIIFYKYKKKHEEIVTDLGEGWCSGGALFIPTKIWKSLGGYKVYSQPYAPDESFLFIKAKSIGYSVCASKSISIIHPHDGNKEYLEWKQQMIKGVKLYE